MEETLFDYYPMIADVRNEYIKQRRRGKDRETAVNAVLSSFSDELTDSDDGPQVWIGLASITASKKELTEGLLERASLAYRQLSESCPEMRTILAASMERICNLSNLGTEAKYPRVRSYKPDWKNGDTFLYHLSGEYPRSFGLDDWNIVIRKIGEFFDDNDNWQELVYISLSFPGNIPGSSDELEQLGFIPFTKRDDGYVCIGKLTFKSSRQLKALNLQKIGCFPNARAPQNEVISVVPSQGWPMIPDSNHKEINDIEVYACLGYKKYGIVF